MSAATLPALDRDALISFGLPMVYGIAGALARTLPSNVLLEDLTSEGFVGLVVAAQRFKPAMQVPFRAYARRRVIGAMLDYLRTEDVLPRPARQLMKQAEKKVQAKGISMVEAMEDVKTSPWRRACTLNTALPGKHLDKILWTDLREGEEFIYSLSLVDPRPSPLDQLLRKETNNRLAREVRKLPKRWQQVLKGYYVEDLRMHAVGSRLGLSECRISQIHKSALQRLRIDFAEVPV